MIEITTKKWKVPFGARGKFIIKKCPDCKGDLIRSNQKVRSAGYAASAPPTSFWCRPWRPNKRRYHLPVLITFSWLCMNCQRVFLYLDDTQGDMIKVEYEEVMKERLQELNSIPQNIVQAPNEWDSYERKTN